MFGECDRGTTGVAEPPSAPPPGLAQAVEHVGIVLGPMPRHTRADKPVECRRRDRDGFLERLLRFLNPPDLAEGGGEPAVVVLTVGVCPDRPMRRLDRGTVFTRQVITDGYGVIAGCQIRIARVKPYTSLKSDPRCCPLARPV